MVRIVITASLGAHGVTPIEMVIQLTRMVVL
jgi:hypothetical protein